MSLQSCCATNEFLKGNRTRHSRPYSFLVKLMHLNQRWIWFHERKSKGCQCENLVATSTCWLSRPCFFQVVQCLVEVTEVVERYAWSIESLEVLSFLLKHFEAILLDSLIIHQLSLEQTCCRTWEQGERNEQGLLDFYSFTSPQSVGGR